MEEGSSQVRSAISVPTEILYEDNKIKWGYTIEPSKPRFQHFKLALNEKRGHEVSFISMTYPDKLQKSPGLNKKAKEMTTDFFKKLHEHIQVYLERKYGQGLLRSTPIQYILTVPAVWSASAKEVTKACAKAAGFGDRVESIIEPEAAVTHAVTVLPGELNIGDTFVVCDAGGGTVDLISYGREEKAPGKPIKISETVRGNGDLCGSSFINNHFREFFIARFEGSDGYGQDTLEEALIAFESLKYTFTGEGDKFYIPVFGLPDNASKSIKRGRLALTSAEMKSFFSHVVTMTTTLVKAQIDMNSSLVSKVLLVGGFGQSEYLKRCIQEVVGPDIDVIQPPGGREAIARGAVIQGFAMTSLKASRVDVKRRIARLSLGIEANVPFQERRHKETLQDESITRSCSSTNGNTDSGTIILERTGFRSWTGSSRE